MTSLLNDLSIDDIIRGLLEKHAHLRTDPKGISADGDLYAAGLSSLSTVDLMLAVEDHFEIEFTSNWLNRRTFASIAGLCHAVRSMQEQVP